MSEFFNVQPSLVITKAIVLRGIFPMRDNGGYGDPVATIGFGSMFAFDFAPTSYSIASGQELALTSNTALFSLLGTTYGGDGKSTFWLPDLDDSLTAGIGMGVGLTSRDLGDSFGANTGFYDASNLPAELGGSAQPLDNTQETLTARYVINTDGFFPPSSGVIQENTIGVVRPFYGNFDPQGTIVCDGRLLNIADYEALFLVIGTTYGGDGETTFALPDLRGRTIVGTGIGPDGTSYTLGEVVGSETASLALGNMGSAYGGSEQPFDNVQPALAMNIVIALQGIYPSASQRPLIDEIALKGVEGQFADKIRRDYSNDDSGTPFLGQMFYFAGPHTSGIAALCNGQLLLVDDYPALFNLLGTQFGGDGVTTFALPDFQGRSAMGSGEYAVGTELGSVDTYADLADMPGRTQSGDDGDDSILGGSEGDSFFGSAGNDDLTGAGGDDFLDGGVGEDVLFGGSGNDTMFGGYFGDTMRGGTGNDFYDRVTFPDTILEFVDEGTDTVRTRVENYTLGDNVENLTLFGSTVVTGNGNALDNAIVGTSLANELHGFDGNDTLSGGRGDDTIYAGIGNDTLVGGAGNDAMLGGLGDDFYDRVGSGDSIIEFSGEGTDTVRTRENGYVLGDGLENLTLFGSVAATGSGNALDNSIIGTGRDNVLNGLDGNDILDGGRRSDTLDGGNGDDILLGNIGHDTLLGGEGVDALTGGNDRDTMTGGAGADGFLFDDGDFAGFGPSTADRITDFSQSDGDTIDLSAIDAIAGTADSSFAFIGAAQFSGTAGELRFAQRDAGITVVQGDTNGDGVADFVIRLDGQVDLTSADFVL